MKQGEKGRGGTVLPTAVGGRGQHGEEKEIGGGWGAMVEGGEGGG